MPTYSVYQLLSFFLIYSFFGWCLEVVYQAVEHGKFINRGFLNGPYCPIYGFGVILVVGTLTPIKENGAVLYIGSVILTSALELVTGFVLEKIFHQHWWDYSGERFNFHGYICLKFSLLWGVACLVAIRIIHPSVERFVDWIPETAGKIGAALILVGFVSDMTITVLAIVKIKNRLKILDDISMQMRRISDYTGQRLFEGVELVMEKKEEAEERNAEYRQKYIELRQRYKKFRSERGAVSKRFEKAFPKLRLDSSAELKKKLLELREHLTK